MGTFALSAKSSSNRQAIVRYVDVLPAAVVASSGGSGGGGGAGGFGAGWIVAIAILGLACVAAAVRSPRTAVVAAVAGALAFAFWRPVIHARVEASVVFAEITFLVTALLARTGRERRFGRMVLLVAALVAANVVVLTVLAIAGAD
jgi:hypothetical protein